MDDDVAVTASKANFDDIYDQRDPRAYYRQLGALGYEVPMHGQRVFSRVLDELPTDNPTVLDVCCSYGVNAALLKHDLGLDELYEHYDDLHVRGLSHDELTAQDRAYFAARQRADAPRVVGVDRASAAVAYAHDVGLLDDAVVVDLESADPPVQMADLVGDTDLVTVTGGVGYITEQTFDRLLDCTDPDSPPWIAALCLRTVSYEPVAEMLADRGLVTEQLEGRTFPQRRFADDAEFDYAMHELAERGVDAHGLETEGAYHVNVYLSRPPGDVDRCPIEAVLGDLPPAR